MIIPVIDIKSDLVVHAIGGQRDFYQPIKSKLTNSAEPVQVAKTLFDHTNSPVMYVADLDSITNDQAKPSKSVSKLLHHFPDREFWIDFGIRKASDFDSLSQFENIANIRYILGTETITSWQDIDQLIRVIGINHFVLSVDSFAAKLLSNLGSFHEIISEWIIRQGKRVILLDIAAVGKGQNDSVLLWKEVICNIQAIDFFLGGGIRNQEDVDRWLEMGAKGVLVATALHNRDL